MYCTILDSHHWNILVIKFNTHFTSYSCEHLLPRNSDRWQRLLRESIIPFTKTYLNRFLSLLFLLKNGKTVYWYGVSPAPNSRLRGGISLISPTPDELSPQVSLSLIQFQSILLLSLYILRRIRALQKGEFSLSVRPPHYTGSLLRHINDCQRMPQGN